MKNVIVAVTVTKWMAVLVEAEDDETPDDVRIRTVPSIRAGDLNPERNGHLMDIDVEATFAVEAGRPCPLDGRWCPMHASAARDGENRCRRSEEIERELLPLEGIAQYQAEGR